MKEVRRKIVNYVLATVLSVSIVGLPMTAAAQGDYYPEDKSMRMMADTFIVRPLMLVGTIIGAATFVVSLPFSAAGGNTDEAWEHLVVVPASYTFGRPLGEEPE